MLTLERVEILMRVIPNEQEVKDLKEYEKDRKPIEALSDEDRFMLNVSFVWLLICLNPCQVFWWRQKHELRMYHVIVVDEGGETESEAAHHEFHW